MTLSPVVSTLTVNYRTPDEIMAEAEPVIRAIPDANVPTPVRRSGMPVIRGVLAELSRVVAGSLAANPVKVACVIAPPGVEVRVALSVAVRVLTPARSKGSNSTWSCHSNPTGSAPGSMTRSTGTLR